MGTLGISSFTKTYTWGTPTYKCSLSQLLHRTLIIGCCSNILSLLIFFCLSTSKDNDVTRSCYMEKPIDLFEPNLAYWCSFNPSTSFTWSHLVSVAPSGFEKFPSIYLTKILQFFHQKIHLNRCILHSQEFRAKFGNIQNADTIKTTPRSVR